MLPLKKSPTFKKFVKIKPMNKGMFMAGSVNTLLKGINRIGDSLEGIHKQFEFSSILQQKDVNLDIFRSEQEIEDLKEDNENKKDFASRTRRLLNKQRRQKKDKNQEEKNEKRLISGDGFRESVDKVLKSKAFRQTKSFFDKFGKYIGAILGVFGIHAAVGWMLKDPEGFRNFLRVIAAVGKFVAKIFEFSVGTILDGLTNLVGDFEDENAVQRTFRFLGGAVQLFGGLAALRFASYLVQPWKILRDIPRLMDLMGKLGLVAGDTDRKTKEGPAAGGFGKKFKAYGRLGRMKAGKFGRGISNKIKAAPGRLASFAKNNPTTAARGAGILGGVARIAGGLAGGEGASQAVGAGVGQAAGSFLGAGVGTAVLGPFLGPFAPMVGSAIGGFLGEFFGKHIGDVIAPIFEPIGRYFGMVGDVLGAAIEPIMGSFGEMFGELFTLLGTIFKFGMEITKPVREFTGFLFSLQFKVVGKLVQTIVENAQRIMNPGSVFKGFLDYATFNLFDFDGYNKKGQGQDVAKTERNKGGAVAVMDPADENKGSTFQDQIIDALVVGFAPTSSKGIVSIISKLTKTEEKRKNWLQSAGSWIKKQGTRFWNWLTGKGGNEPARNPSSGESQAPMPSGPAAPPVTGTKAEKWVEFRGYGKNAGAKYPNLVAAQFALESGWGSALSAQHNYFGIKAAPGESATTSNTREVINGKTVYMDEPFKNFQSPQAAVNHLVTQWYKDYKGYKGVNNAPDAFAAAQMLKDESYATDPDYAPHLQRLLRQNMSLASGGELLQFLMGGGKVKHKRRTSKGGLGEPDAEGYQKIADKVEEKREIQGRAGGGVADVLSTNGRNGDVTLTPQTPFSQYNLHHGKPDNDPYNTGPKRINAIPRDYVIVRDWANQALDRGTPVVAGVPGKIVHAGGSHNTIVIQDNNGKDRMQFHHFDQIKTSVGAAVTPSTIIGTQGNVPSGDVHVHLDASASDHRAWVATQLGAEFDASTMSEVGEPRQPGETNNANTSQPPSGAPTPEPMPKEDFSVKGQLAALEAALKGLGAAFAEFGGMNTTSVSTKTAAEIEEPTVDTPTGDTLQSNAQTKPDAKTDLVSKLSEAKVKLDKQRAVKKAPVVVSPTIVAPMTINNISSSGGGGSVHAPRPISLTD